MKFKGKRCLVYGLGESGRSAIRLLVSLGAYVFFYDDDISYAGQVGYVKHIEDEVFDYVIISPGVQILDNPKIEILKKKKAKILSEIDLGYLFSKGKILAITGTNGKTTTSMLVAKILKEAGYETFLCGNIGLPMTSVCQKTSKKSIMVVEVSSFQLETSQHFKCDVGAILNVQGDHLDRHKTFLNYFLCKQRLLLGAKTAVLNFDDNCCKNIKLSKRKVFFSKFQTNIGVFIKNGYIYQNRKKILSVSDIKILGEKNLENVLAVLAILKDFKINKKLIQSVVSSFAVAEHRIEIVGQFNNITFVDDSKATNVASTINALSAFKNSSVILLLGGQGKEILYDDIFEYKTKLVVCFGKEGKNIFDACNLNGAKAEIFEKFDDAVKFACSFACENDVVLLSPACSSFDEFSSYRERGDRFKELVLEFAHEK